MLVNAPASWTAVTSGAKSPLSLGTPARSGLSHPGLFLIQSGDSADSVAALQNLADARGAPGISAFLFDSEFAGDNSGRGYYMPFTPIPKLTRLKAMGRTASGFGLKLIGEAGRKLEIQASSDFKTWEPIFVVTMGNQSMAVKDSTADIYRTVQRE